jgi:hypothetical protein
VRSRGLVVEVLPEIVLGAGLTFFLLDEFDAATSALSSGRAIWLMLVTVVAWGVARLAAWRFVPWRAARLIAFGTAAIGVLAVVVFPAYDDTTVVETFPVAAASASAGTSSSPVVPTTPATAPPAATTAPPVTAAGGSAPPSTASTSTAPPSTVPPSTTTTTTLPAAPAAVRRGELAGIDHRAEGSAVTYRDVDGTSVVGLESIDIQPGPDYDVYVVAGVDRRDVDGGLRLDDLRGNIGTQFYEAPDDVDLTTGDWTVMVWCQTFDVPIANATPTPV